MKNKFTLNNIIAALGILGLFLIGVSLSVYMVQNFMPAWCKVALGAGLVLALAYAGFSWKSILGMFKSKTFFASSHTIITAIVVLAILCLANYIGYRHHKRIDLTQGGQYSLSSQTQQLLKKLPSDLKIIAFYSKKDNPYYVEIDSLLKSYAASSPKVKVQMVDPEKNPGMARDYDARDGLTVLEFEGKRKSFTSYEEKDISANIMQLLHPEQSKIYFLTGHGESSLDDEEKLGYSQIRQALVKENYIPETISLASQPALPADMSALVIAGPKKPLFPAEVAMIQNYIKQGGRVFIMVNPLADSLNDLLKPLGVTAENNVIVDPTSTMIGADAFSIAVGQYPVNDITRGLAVTVFPYSRSLSPDTANSGQENFQPLLVTSKFSWGETSMKGKSVEYNEGQDEHGPLVLGVTWEYDPSLMPGADTTKVQPVSRVVVIGNDVFATNQMVSIGGNRDLFLNSISWLAGNSEFMGIRAKEPQDRQLALTSMQSRLMALISLILLPGLLIGLAILIWMKKR
jgi:ABC-type uncharacterized transport system involved in gliding motility auxiliary subunit